jgi:DNA-binding NarL/FixJ family response regulator
VVSRLLTRAGRAGVEDPIGQLTPREREVLALMAEGRSNGQIATELVVSDGAVEKHTQQIFAKLGLAPDDARHRRVTAVLAYLRSV